MERQQCFCSIDHGHVAFNSHEHNVVVVAWPAHHDVRYFVPWIFAAEEEEVFGVGDEDFRSCVDHHGCDVGRFIEGAPRARVQLQPGRVSNVSRFFVDLEQLGRC